jgi:hypothetical protein
MLDFFHENPLVVVLQNFGLLIICLIKGTEKLVHEVDSREEHIWGFA